MRALAIAALVCGCSRNETAIRADDAHLEVAPAITLPDACERMTGTWKMREFVDDQGVHPESLRVMRIGVGEIVQTIGDEATKEDRQGFRVLERGRESCRIRTQAGAVLMVRPVEPRILEVGEGTALSRWVRVTEPLPSPP